MRQLAELLAAVPEAAVVGPRDRPVERIGFVAAEAGPGDLFVALAGNHVDGHARIDEAVAAGARAILCERLPDARRADVTYLIVEDSIRAMGRLAHAFHGDPSHALRVVGVTGTNGKTTTAALLHRLFRRLGHRAGLLSNIGDFVDDAFSPPRYTTGHALFLAGMMARMADAGCGYCFMEVSSQSVPEQRIEGVRFAGGIFTNLTRDHLDYHGTMEGYAGAKRRWLDALPPDAFALVNLDDPRGRWMAEGTAARRRGYGTGADAAYRLRIEDERLTGLTLSVAGRTFSSPLLGAFNAYNLAACFAAACELGQDADEVAATLAAVPPVEGRMQSIRAADGRVAIVDYAHTPDAVEQVLRLLAGARAGGGRITTVIGCGGGGDTRRRALIAAAAIVGSDRLILTSDNPRGDDPLAILADMRSGLDRAALARTETIVDRRAAIFAACASARPGDVVLIAGRGHERHQDIGGVLHPLDDREVAAEALAS